MICEPTIEVCCDGCGRSVDVELNYTYTNSGSYDTSDDSVEETLIADNEWIIKNDNHYCCEHCANQGAAIAALATIIKKLIKENPEWK